METAPEETQHQQAEAPSAVTTTAGKIHAAILGVMSEIGAIGKNRENQQQRFKFRGIADALVACQPLFVKYRMYVRPLRVSLDRCDEITSSKGSAGYHTRQNIVYRATSTEDGSFVDGEVSGEALDYSDKCAGKVMSIAFKYFLFQLFCIPEDDPNADPDATSPEAGKKTGAKPPAAAAARPSSPPATGAKAKGPVTQLVDVLKAKGYETPEKILDWAARQLGKKKLTSLRELGANDVTKLRALADAIPAPGSGPAE
jgi:hypothetical protein